MKRLLILMLVLGMATAASAFTITYEYRDSGGVTPISVVNLALPNFTLAVIGTYTAGESGGVRLYDQFENIGAGSDHADFTGGTMYLPAAGSVPPAFLGAYLPTYDGYDFNWGSGSTGQTGALMFLFDLTASAEGTVNISTYETDYWTVIETASIEVVPEPMTIALLGLGGLFLRRRK